MNTRRQSRELETGLVASVYALLRRIPVAALWFIVIIWSLPTVSLFINSWRSRDDQRRSGWWTTKPSSVTLENYRDVFSVSTSSNIGKSLLNSMAISIPATIIPIAIAAFAAYAFAWMDFRGRKPLFIATVSLLALPLQVALIPLLQLYVGGAHLSIPWIEKTVTLFPDLNLANTSTAVWLTHTGFALPFAIFLIHNYIAALPKEILESARVDGADHFAVFWRLVVPLSMPVLAAFAIFQFLWTWNDYLIANTMAGTNPEVIPTTILIANLAGDFGTNEHLLPAAAFVQTAVPLIVFFSMQRYFVRGLIAGAVKG